MKKNIMLVIVFWTIFFIYSGSLCVEAVTPVQEGQPNSAVTPSTNRDDERKVVRDDGELPNLSDAPYTEVQTLDSGLSVRLPITKSQFDAFTSAQQYIGNVIGNSIRAYTLNDDNTYFIIISGNDPLQVEEAQNKLMFILGQQQKAPRCLVDITALLKEYTQQETKTVGFPLLPQTIQPQGSNGGTTQMSFQFGPNQNQQTSPPASFAYDFKTSETWFSVNLYNDESLGKVLVGATVSTANGVPCTISSTDNQPIVVSQGGSQTSTMQTIVTSVQVTPTVVSFDFDNIGNSVVRLDLVVQLSIPTGQLQGAIAFTQKNLTMSRLVKANGLPIIAGSFVSDQNQPENNYIPILGEIPIIKYFFSSNNVTVARDVAVLMLAVKIVPEFEYNKKGK